MGPKFHRREAQGWDWLLLQPVADVVGLLSSRMVSILAPAGPLLRPPLHPAHGPFTVGTHLGKPPEPGSRGIEEEMLKPGLWYLFML